MEGSILKETVGFIDNKKSSNLRGFDFYDEYLYFYTVEVN